MTYFFSVRRTRRTAMIKNNGIDARRASSMNVTWVGLLIAVLLLCGIAPAAERKSGNTLALTLKNGQTIKGELLTVKGDRLILLNANSLAAPETRIGDVAWIRIMKKSRLLPGLGRGLLIGGASGAVLGLLSGGDQSGFLSFSVGQTALVGALGLGLLGASVGGIIGAIAGIDETMDVGTLTASQIDQVLNKLKQCARVAGEIPATLKVLPSPIAQEEAKPTEKETKPALPEKAVEEPSQPIKSESYSRFHLSLVPGYFRSSGLNQLGDLMRDVGFSGVETYSGLFGSGTTEYPDTINTPDFYVKDVKIEYSLSRKFALGLAYCPLGEHAVSGRHRISGKDFRPDYFPLTYLVGSYSGHVFFLTASYFPIPDAFLKKFSVKLTAGFGYGKMRMDYYGSEDEYGYQDLVSSPYFQTNKKSFSKNGVGALVSAEAIHFFNPHWSLGINADYKYVPVHIGGFALDCPYSYYDASPASGGSIRYDVLRVDIPSRNYNFGGLGIGVHFGFHF
jgi:hypothetical protein